MSTRSAVVLGYRRSTPTADFLAFRSRPPEVQSSLVTDGPRPLQISSPSGRVHPKCSRPWLPTVHAHCTFPRLQVASTRSAVVLGYRRSTPTAPFLAFRSRPPEVQSSLVTDGPRLSSPSVRVHPKCSRPWLPTVHAHCTFPRLQVASTRSAVVLGYRRSTPTAPFLAFRSRPPEVQSSLVTDGPRPLHLSSPSGRVHPKCSRPWLPTVHAHCTFPRLQVASTRSAVVLGYRRSTPTAPFLAFRSRPPEVQSSLVTDGPRPLHLSSPSGRVYPKCSRPWLPTVHAHCTFPHLQVASTRSAFVHCYRQTSLTCTFSTILYTIPVHA